MPTRLLNKLPPSLLKFGVTGVGATLIHIVVVTLLIELFDTNVGLANGIAFTTATLFSKTVNTRWSFNTKLTKRIVIRFWLVALFCCGLSVAIALFIESVGAHYLLGVAAIVSLVPFITYLLHHYWTYR